VHDTTGHLRKLAQAARGAAAATSGAATPATGSAALTAEATELARRILDAGARLPPLGDLPRRVIHGDFGLHNLLIDGDVVAPVDVPSFDRSNLDGFAVRAAHHGLRFQD